MPKNSPKYLDKLKECKNISHIFIDNLKGRIYNRKFGTVQMSADIDNKAAGFMLDQPFDEVI